MGRLDDPRPGRRLVRAIVAFIAVGLVVWTGLALTTVAAPDPSAPSLAAATRASASAASAATSPSAASSATPTARPTLIVPAPPSRPAVRALTVRARLQTELDAIRVRLGIPGVSVTVLFRDGSSWSGVSGDAVVAENVAVEDGTAFALGSVSKTYTAALILALAGDGEIDLDASARSYLKEMPLDPKITVRQLLNHTSGLDDFFLHAGIDKALLADRGAFWSVRRTLKYVAKPYFPPGRGWHYSNTNYLYLGLIAQRVAGVPLAKALEDRFFGPLGLDHTWYQAVAKPRGPVAHGYRFASSSRNSPPIDLSDGSPVAPFTSVVSAAGGAGSIAATSSDLAQWARLLYTGKVLGPEMTAEMLNGVAATAGYAPRVPYGLGVQAFPIDGRLALGHSGRLLGFRAAVRHIPSEALTIAVLTNQSRADPGLIVEQLLGVIFAPDPPCFSCQHPS